MRFHEAVLADADIQSVHAQVRQRVLRQFEIMGDALAQLSKTDPKLAARIPDASIVIGFRNVLIIGSRLDRVLVWVSSARKRRDQNPLSEGQ